MIAVERLTNKLQELFGGNYYMLPFYKLNTEYTTATQVVENGNVGYVNYYSDAYSKLRKEKIIGVVNLQNPQRANSDMYYVTSSFTVDFSVPMNIKDKYEYGEAQYSTITYEKSGNNYIFWYVTLPHKTMEDVSLNINVVSKDNEGNIVGKTINFKVKANGIDASHLESANGLTIEEIEQNKNLIKINSCSPEKFKYKKFDFFKDYEYVVDKIINKTIEFDNKYRGKMVVSEPVYQLTEKDGEYEYAIFRVTGTFAISDRAIFGSDYKVEIFVNFGSSQSWIEIDGINSFVEMINNGSNAIIINNATKTEQNVAQSAWTCTISVDDTSQGLDVYNTLKNIVHYNQEIISDFAETEAEKRKIKTRITLPDGNTREFWAIVSITFRTTRNGVGTYDISFTDDNKGV